MVQAEGLEAVFECLYPGALAYDWALNRTFSTILPSGVSDTFSSGGVPARLIIPATPQYNNTVVQCEAVVATEEGGSLLGMRSVTATLQVQSKFSTFIFMQCSILCSYSETCLLKPVGPKLMLCSVQFNLYPQATSLLQLLLAGPNGHH